MPADPNDPRLAELYRQRAIVAQHLAWLDTQIAHAADPALPSATLPLPQTVNRKPETASLSPFAPTSAHPSSATSPESILAQAPSGIPANEKWGCIAIVLVLGLLILGALFGLPYLLHYN